AVRNGDIEQVKKTLGEGVGLNTTDRNGKSPLSIASEKGYNGIVRLLLDKGANLSMKSNDRGRTALHSASNNGHLEVVKLLLFHRAGINAGDQAGQTALHL
ncbi:ankyrin repeat protein, partial [Colletotrichum eremochloae]